MRKNSYHKQLDVIKAEICRIVLEIYPDATTSRPDWNDNDNPPRFFINLDGLKWTPRWIGFMILDDRLGIGWCSHPYSDSNKRKSEKTIKDCFFYWTDPQMFEKLADTIKNWCHTNPIQQSGSENG